MKTFEVYLQDERTVTINADRISESYPTINLSYFEFFIGEVVVASFAQDKIIGWKEVVAGK